MSSPAQRTKIAQARAFAPHELLKARLCADLILTAVDGGKAMESAVAQLKQGLGNNWSPITALQFMSGRRGEFAADCAAPQEQARLYLAHLVAKQVCSDKGFGAVAPPDGIDVVKLNSLVAAFKNKFSVKETDHCRLFSAPLVSTFKPSFPNPTVWTDELINARQAEYAAFQKTPEGIAEAAAFDYAYSELIEG